VNALAATAVTHPPGFLARYVWLLLALTLVEVGVIVVLLLRRRRRRRRLEHGYMQRSQPRFSGISPLKLTQLAVLISGQERAPSLSDEWHSHLSGEPGHGLTRAQQMRAACGFLRAGVCYRLQDVGDLWWKLADKVLASRRWSNAVVWLPTLIAAVIVIRRGGLYDVVVNFESLASLCGSLFLAIRLGRKRRRVKLPERKSEHGR
jgi:heme exporter protein D